MQVLAQNSFSKMPHFHTGVTGQPRTHPNPEAASGPWDTETQSQAPDGSNKWPLSIGNTADLNQEHLFLIMEPNQSWYWPQRQNTTTTDPHVGGMAKHTVASWCVCLFVFGLWLNFKSNWNNTLIMIILLQMINKYFWAPINGESGSSGMKFGRVFLIPL